MATATVIGKKRLLFHDVDWRDYGRFLRMFQDRPSVRLTYDCGDLEIIPTTHLRNTVSRFLARLATILTEELELPILGGGSTTLRRRRQSRGLDPDECFWIANERAMRGKDKLDLRVAPPPDLAIEIDVSKSSLPRQSIYAALRVPELWRFDGREASFWMLKPNGDYGQRPKSRIFPFLKAGDFTPFLQRLTSDDQNAIARDFRSWVRGEIGQAVPRP